MRLFYYYMFELDDKKFYYYTTVPQFNEKEILDHATNYGLIRDEDVPNCNNVRELSLDEVQRVESELYKEWWEKRQLKIAKGEEEYTLPPSIGVQLN